MAKTTVTQDIGSEVKIRNYAEPLQNQLETTSYSSRYVYPMDFDYDLDSTNLAVYEGQMIHIWRQMAKNPYVAFAIDDIINEMLSYTDENKYPVTLDLGDTTFSKNIRSKIHDEWINIMKYMQFHKKSYQYLWDWFVDGKQYFYVEYSEKEKTITKIIALNPCRVKRTQNEEGEVKYIYQNIETSNQVLEIDANHIIDVNSGLMDDRHNIWISYLNTAYIPLNQLNNIEDALLIYRIARAPERRVVYIDTGSLPKSKAETYMKEVIRNLKNKVEYDSSTGKIKESALHMSLLDDIYLPRSADGQGTEITTLQGSQSGFNDLSDLDYFKQKLFRSLNIPYSRWSETNTPYGMLGRSAEITRDEVKYRKFIIRLRIVYSALFTKLLRLQCRLKNIITEKEYNDNYENIQFEWSSDSAFTELRDLEIMGERLNVVDRVIPYLGTLYSNQWIKQKILRQSDEDIAIIKEQNAVEKAETAEVVDAANSGGIGQDEGSDLEM